MIPSYQQQTRLSIGAPAAQPHMMRPADPTGQALEQIGDTFLREDERRQGLLKKQEDEDARVWAGQAVSDFRLKRMESLQAQKDTAKPGAPDFTPNFLTDFDEKADAVLAMAPNDASKRYLQQHLISMRDQFGAHALDFQAGAIRGDRINRHADSIDTSAKIVQQDPSQFGPSMVAIDETRPDVPPEQREKLKDYAQAKLTEAAAGTMLIKDPLAVKEATGKAMGADGFSGPTGVPWVDAAKPEQVAKWNHEATVALDRVQNSARSDLEHRVHDFQAFAGGVPLSWQGDPAAQAPTRQEFAKAFGAEKGDKLFDQQVGVFIDQLRATQTLSTMAAADRAKVIEQAGVTEPEGSPAKLAAQHNLVQANALIEKALKDDAAGYVSMSSPRVKATRESFQQAVRDGSPDAAKLFDTYATESIAEQRRMGVLKPQLLTTGEAESIVSGFMSSPPGQAAQLVAQLEKGYGKRFPEVYQQLAHTGKLTEAALVIPNMKDPGSRERMAAASGIKTEDLATLIPQADRNDLKAKLQDQFRAGAQSFIEQSPKGLGLVNTVMNAAEKLAVVYRSQGKSVSDASKQAYDEVMGWKYDFQATYRTPRYDVAGAPIDTNLVQLGAGKALADMQGVKSFVTPYPMRPEQLVEQTEDAVRANGFWVTNEDETGLELRIKGQDNSRPVVRRQDGSKVAVSFRDLEKLARDTLTEEQRQAAEARAEAAKRLAGSR